MKRNEMSEERCSYCSHLWRFHKTERDSALGAYYSCSQCYMRKDKGLGFVKKGTRLGAHPWHSTRPRMKHCRCWADSEECEAVIYHGPGHQSHTHCTVKGQHSVHRCSYGGYGEVATWKGKMRTASGYFDEPPDCEE